MTQATPIPNPASFAERYERVLVQPLFRPFALALVERANLVPGDRVLDLACGTGIVARLARERIGKASRIVGIDLNTAMLGVARAVAPDIEWREGNAVELALGPDEKFEVIFCHQGLQFFPDRRKAAGEVRRALVSGGRLLLGTWRPLEENPFFQTLHAVAERRLGPIVDQRHAFGDEEAIRALLAEAGFSEVQVETISRRVHFPDPVSLPQMNAMALVGMSAAGKAMSEAERAQAAEELAAESAETVRTFTDGAGITFELASNLAIART